MNTFELHYPTDYYRVNQPFGTNGDYYQKAGINIKGHNGIDLYAPHGAFIRAAHDGVVIAAGKDGMGGNVIVIVSDDEFDTMGGKHRYETLYGHLANGCIFVRPGQHVHVGEIIGLADNTGLSTGSHLHFGLKRVRFDLNLEQYETLDKSNGYLGAIDPAPYWSGEYAHAIASLVAQIANLRVRVGQLLASKQITL